MFLVEVLPEVFVHSKVLTYSSEFEIEIGSVVKIPIRNKTVYGVVFSCHNRKNIPENSYLYQNIAKVKQIDSITPFKLSHKSLSFLKKVAYNTFNEESLVFQSLLEPFKLLTKKDLKILNEMSVQNKNIPNERNEKEEITKSNYQSKVEFIRDYNYSLRIRYIIRNIIDTISQSNHHAINQQILIVFPEYKLLKKVIHEFSDEKEFYNNVETTQYTSLKDAQSKQTIKHLINLTQSKNNRIHIIFSLRSGLYLPFNNLQSVIIIDESHPFHIQEQNSFYYDTRDIAYILSLEYLTSLFFISGVPSIRLHSFYSEAGEYNKMTDNIDQYQKRLDIKLFEYERKSANSELISAALEGLLEELVGDNDEVTIYNEI